MAGQIGSLYLRPLLRADQFPAGVKPNMITAMKKTISRREIPRQLAAFKSPTLTKISFRATSENIGNKARPHARQTIHNGVIRKPAGL